MLSSHFSRECSAERPAGRSGGVARGGIRNPLRVSCTPFCKEPAAGRQHSPAAGWRHVPARRSVQTSAAGRQHSLASCVKAAGTAEPFPLNLGEVGEGSAAALLVEVALQDERRRDGIDVFTVLFLLFAGAMPKEEILALL